MTTASITQFTKKFFAIFFVVTFILIPLNQSLEKQEVEAAFATEITQRGHVMINNANMGINSVTAGYSGGSFMMEAAQSAKDVFGGDRIAYLIAKMLLSSITDSLVNWINSGFQGSPTFIEDLERHMFALADREISNILFDANSPLSVLCTPFRFDIQGAITMHYANSLTTDETGYTGVCSLEQAGHNVDRFLSGDFINGGGFDAWFEATQFPMDNTAIGSYYKSKDIIDRTVAKAKAEENRQLDWGQGFISIKGCVEAGQNGNCKTFGKIQTPGTMISAQLKKHFDIPVDQLNLADEIDEIVAALLSQLVNRALSGGLQALTGGGGGSSYTSRMVAESTSRLSNQATNASMSQDDYQVPLLDSSSIPLADSSDFENLSNSDAAQQLDAEADAEAQAQNNDMAQAIASAVASAIAAEIASGNLGGGTVGGDGGTVDVGADPAGDGTSSGDVVDSVDP